MKKLIFGCVVSFAVASAFAATHNVPADGDLATVVAAAQSGDEVVIAASGSPYALSAELAIPAGVTVRGATGNWKDVILDGQATYQGLDLASGSAVSNLTVRNCKARGVNVQKNARLENCRVTGGTDTVQAPGHSSALGVLVSGGTVTRCLIDNNAVTGTDRNSKAAGLYATGSAVVSHTVITNNYMERMKLTDAYYQGTAGVYFGTARLEYCYVGQNHVGCLTAVRDAAGVAGFTGTPTLDHCTFAENTYGGPVADNVYGVYFNNKSAVVTDTIFFGNGHEATGEMNDAYFGTASVLANFSNIAAGVVKPEMDDFITVTATADDFVHIGGKLVPKASSSIASLGSEPAWNGSDPVDPEPGVTATVSTVADLAAALATAKAGDIIVVKKGTYLLSATVSVPAGVTVCGETNDCSQVVFDGQDAIRCVRLLGFRSVLKNVTVTRGRANEEICGGGVRMNVGSRMENCRVTGCVHPSNYSQYAKGTAVYNYGGSVIGCRIDANECKRASYRAIGYYGGAGLLDRSVVRNNTAPSTTLTDGNYAGIAGCWVDGGMVRNSVINGNSPGTVSKATISAACGVRINGDGAQLLNCLVYDNTYSGTSCEKLTGVYANTAVVVNSVVLDNGFADTKVENLTADPRHLNLVTDAATAAGCTDSFSATLADLFIQQGGEYDIKSGSDLIDAGVARFSTEQGLDFYGRDRLAGAAIDIGPFEYHQPPFACTFDSPVYSGFDRLVTTATAHPSGDTAGIVYNWFADGASEPFATGADKQTVTIDFSTLGAHTVTLKAVNGAALEATFAQTYTVAQSSFFVRAGNPGAAAPYATRETAAADLETAVAAAGVGATVWVEGLLTNAAPTTVDKAITVRGLSREGTVLSGGGVSKVIRLTAAGATLADLTVADAYGSAFHELGVGVYLGAGTVMSNCVVRNCQSGNDGYGSGVYAASAKVYDTVITNCLNGCGTALYLTGAGALAVRMTVRNNRFSGQACDGYKPRGAVIADELAELRDSVVAGNSFTAGTYALLANAGMSASGVRITGGARAVNCTVVGNVQDVSSSDYLGFIGGVASGDGDVVNCLIADNVNKDGSAADNALQRSDLAGYVTCCTSAITNFPAGNVSSEPGPVYRYSKRRDEYRLTQTSPCIGAGTWQTWMETSADIYGRPWKPGKADIGAAANDCKGLTLLVR